MNKTFVGKTLPKSMKKVLLLLAGASLSFSSCTTQSPSISGSLTDVESDSLLVFVSRMSDRSTYRTDTIGLVNNSFELQLPDSSFMISLVAKPKSPNGAIRMSRRGPILFFPGDKLKVEGGINDYVVTGNELYDGLQKHDDINQMQTKIDELNEEYIKAYREKNEAEKDRIKNEIRKINDQMQQAKFEVVEAEPNSMTAAYFATQLAPEKGLKAIALLSDNVKNNSMSVLVEKAKESYERILVKEKAKLGVQPGKPAPDFQLTTIDGKEITLASFSGKHLLIDFWGTWCGWCVKGIPEMKKAYEKHREQIEFLGVCCRDTDKSWREGVAKYELPWVNAFEGNTNLAPRFAVNGYPTKVLIGPDGKIIEVFVGETAELYKRLDELFGK